MWSAWSPQAWVSCSVQQNVMCLASTKTGQGLGRNTGKRYNSINWCTVIKYSCKKFIRFFLQFPKKPFSFGKRYWFVIAHLSRLHVSNKHVKNLWVSNNMLRKLYRKVHKQMSGPHACRRAMSVNLQGLYSELIILWIKLIVWLLKTSHVLCDLYICSRHAWLATSCSKVSKQQQQQQLSRILGRIRVASFYVRIFAFNRLKDKSCVGIGG